MADIFGESEAQKGLEPEDIEEVISEADPLKIDLDDDVFVRVMNKNISDSKAFFRTIHLYERRDKNELYFLGQQVAELEKNHKLKPYQARYLDNVIFEAEGTLRAVAISRVPDLICKPGDENPDSQKSADDLTEVINNRLRIRENRTVLGMAYTHRPIYFTGVIKAVWDDEKGTNGDYRFENIHPDDIDIDHTANINDADSMNWVAHHYNLTVKECLMRWPKKKKELLELLGYDEIPAEEKLATTIKISEIWFTWFDKEEDEWKRIEGTAWKYKSLLFDKIKNPYWDWEGEDTLFTFDTFKGVKRKINETDAKLAMMMGQAVPNSSNEKIYYNYFQDPRKPFCFLGFNQLGKIAYDETSRIEQCLYLQDNVNLRGTQISNLAAGAKGKNVFSTESGLKASDVAEIDMGNPDQDVLVDGDLRQVYSHIPGTQPTQALFQEQDMNRERLFSKEGTNAALRGIRGGENTATQTQIFKESDYTRIDDEVESTINSAAEWMADWAMQFIKLFYTEEHLVKLVGAGGKTLHMKINRDLIEDGMEVEVSASSVDKLRRKREAYELAGIGKGDPVQFYKDIEASDPEGRAKAEMLFNLSPMLYFQKYVEKNENTEQMTQALGEQPVNAELPSPEAQAIQAATMQPPEVGV